MMFNTISERNKGYLWIAGGTALLFHTLGILDDWLYYALIAGSLGMIVYGFIKARVHNQVQDLINKYRNQQNNRP